MRLNWLAVRNYRSLQDLTLTVENPCVVVGGNGTGKSSLYRALQLLSAAATGTFARRIAEEGGMSSALWAGPRNKRDLKLFRMGVEAGFDDWTYKLTAGLPTPTEAGFKLDPRVKEETLHLAVPKRKTGVPFLDRTRPSASLRDPDGAMAHYAFDLSPTESVLSQIGDPARYPELARLRETILAWRFYDYFDVGANSVLRQSQVGTMTPALGSDGSDLPAALATLHEVDRLGCFDDVNAMISAGLNGSTLEVVERDGRFSFQVHQPGLLRPLAASELSSGTLRFIALAVALHPLMAPTLTVFNEPETSLHQDLLPVLGDALAMAAEHRPLWIITHSTVLADRIAARSGVLPLQLEKVDGATQIAD